MLQDAQGHAVSGATANAVALYNQAIHAATIGHGDAMGALDAAIAAAPDFAMPRIAKGWLFALSRDPMLAPRAQSAVRDAAARPTNDRERSHLAALQKAATGARLAAIGLLDRHLMAWPRDILAHQMALLFDLSQGRVRWMRDRTARALPQFPRAVPGHAALQSFHAFGLEENGDYARAEDVSRDVADAEPHSWFAHHTVSHVMEMMGRAEDGIGWMASREAYWATREHPNQDHIWWHKALYHLDLGQYDEAVAIYDGPFLASEKKLAMSLTHSSALLWRLDTLGVDVAARWQALLPRWEGHADGRWLVFADLHAIMAELRSGHEALAETRLAAMRATAASDDEAAETYREVGVPLAEGLTAFHRGDYAQAVDWLLPARFELWRIGGSAAQRDVFDWTLAEAAGRAELRDVAVSLAHERLALKPHSAVNRRFLAAGRG
ncbi:MAG: tetratricopeptide repeat protein [Proteobacteria bacterium]|nr:tetratricopeptide repeat protein [Pseudomonadota bacterium]